MIDATVFGDAREFCLLADKVVTALDRVLSSKDMQGWERRALGSARGFMEAAKKGQAMVSARAVHAGAVGISRAYGNALRTLRYLGASGNGNGAHTDSSGADALDHYSRVIARIDQHLKDASKKLPGEDEMRSCRAFFAAQRRLTLLEDAGPVEEARFTTTVPVA